MIASSLMGTKSSEFVIKQGPEVSLQELETSVDFQQLSIHLYGREVPQPRLVAWYGPCAYTYSRLTLPPRTMPPILSELAKIVSEQAEEAFNSVMCNLYRNGSDSVSWHADDEAIFERDPIIASLSIGAPRKFVARHNVTKEKQSWELGHGSLLIMGRGVQPNYQHAIMKTKKSVGPRINLTFRKVPEWVTKIYHTGDK